MRSVDGDLSSFVEDVAVCCPNCVHIDLEANEEDSSFFETVAASHPGIESLRFMRLRMRFFSAMRMPLLTGPNASALLLSGSLRTLELPGHRADAEAMRHLVLMPALSKLSLMGMALGSTSFPSTDSSIESEGWRIRELHLETMMDVDDVLAFSHWPDGVTLVLSSPVTWSFLFHTDSILEKISRTALAADRLARWDWTSSPERSASIDVIGDYVCPTERRALQARLIRALVPLPIDGLSLDGWDIGAPEIRKVIAPSAFGRSGLKSLVLHDCVMRPSAWASLVHSASLVNLVVDMVELGPTTIERSKALLASVERPFSLSLPGIKFKKGAMRRMELFVEALNRQKRSRGIPEITWSPTLGLI